MTNAGHPQDETAAPVVLYVCADRDLRVPGAATRSAQKEGYAFAQEHGLTITEVVTDAYGEPDPARRHGWRQVKELAETGDVTAVLVRWPNAIAPQSTHELRNRETTWLQEQGVRVLYTWAPLASRSGQAR